MAFNSFIVSASKHFHAHAAIYTLLLLIGLPKTYAQKGQTAMAPASGVEIWEGRVIFKLKPEGRTAIINGFFTDPVGQEIASTLQATVFPAFEHLPAAVPRTSQNLPDLSLCYSLQFPEETPVFEAVRLLNSWNLIEYAEPWYLYQLFYQPNDPLADTTQSIDYQWHLAIIQAREAWELHRNDTTVVVGVIDTGISFLHPDLQDNLQHNYADPIDGIDNDLDGYLDNYRGWDFGGSVLGGTGDNDPSEAGHGVGVAGSFAATTDNGIGAAGTCFNCRYIPIKAIADDKPEIVAFGYQGVLYAAMQGAQIINCSWGAPVYSKFGKDVVQFITGGFGAAIIAAAGNSQADQAYYPAAYSEVISVANSTYGDTICCNSTFNFSVNVSAPGYEIVSPVGNSGYAGIIGTSFSSPVAAGATAIVKGYFPQYTGFQAGQRLRVTTDNIYQINPDKLDKLGTGRINMLKALTAPPLPSIRLQNYTLSKPSGSLRVLAGDTLVIDGTWFNHLDPTTSLEIQAGARGFQRFFLTPIDTVLTIGQTAGNGQDFHPQAKFRFKVNSNVPSDFTFDIRLTYLDPAMGYEDYEYLTVQVNRSYLDIEVNELFTSVNSRGNIGFNDYTSNQQGLGAQYQGYNNALFEAGFLIGNGPIQVSDRIRSGTFQDNDFTFTQRIEQLSSGPADHQTTAVFNDQSAPTPLGVVITQKTYAFQDPSIADFVFFEYEVENTSQNQLNNLFGGIFSDWDLATATQNRNISDYDVATNSVFVYDLGTADPYYYGWTLLSDESFRAYANLATGAFGYTNSDKFAAISNPPNPTTSRAGFSTNGADVMHFIGGGPFSLAPSTKRKLAFAMVAGANLSDFLAHARAAKTAYQCRILELGPKLSFTVSDTVVTRGAQVQFGDQNTGAISWSWNFGDGSSATQANPVHSYAQPGSYIVRLKVSDGTCESTFSKTIEVTPLSSLPNLSETTIAWGPNPVENWLQGNFSEEITQPVTLKITDLMGREVYYQVIPNSQGEAIRVDLSKLATGPYLIKWEYRGAISSKMIWKKGQ